MLKPGTILHGTYRIDDYLSSGGFGNTYIATHIHFGEQFAIKEFFMRGVSVREGKNALVSISNSENEEEFNGQKGKFMKEAGRLRSLNNPHIVRVYDLFEENGTAYYVMDYIDGENLKERLERTGEHIGEPEVADVLDQILDALQEVHKQGLWHLDLKPANVMVDREGVVKLIDFGASKQLDNVTGGALSTSAVAFTNGYAPAEQMEQNYSKLGPWTDFYALGATLYNLLTNQRPPMPSDVNDDKTPDKHLALPFPSGISKKMRDLVLWLMSPVWSERPTSVREILKYINANAQDSAPVYGVTDVPVDEETVKKDPLKPDELSEGQESKSSKEPVVSALVPSKKSNKKLIIGLIAAAMIAVGLFVLFGNSGGSNVPIEEVDTVDTTNVVVDTTNVVTDARQHQDSVIQQAIDDMVLVEAGTFKMGATNVKGGFAGDGDEKPVHSVTLSDYYIGKYEVTQELWLAVMGNNPGASESEKGEQDNLKKPVVHVSWDDCQEFLGKLNKMTGKTFRMPTEAEWEYAARGGNRSKGYKYAGGNSIDDVAWYNVNACHVGDSSSNYGINVVGSKSPNELGLYDMSGNVLELCQDWYGDDYYKHSPSTNPSGPTSGKERVFRGGSWLNPARYCRVSERGSYNPSTGGSDLGFRLALSASETVGQAKD